MKTPVPVTLDDLQVTAKDDKRGLCIYGGLKIYWDDATGNFNYWFDGKSVNGERVKDILLVYFK